MFNIEEYDIEGLLSIKANNFSDKRGSLTKIFQIEDFKNIGIEEQFKEEYYSISKNGVLRGMHFQLPPKNHGKLVSCLSGEVLDIVIDLRKNSKTFGQYEKIELSGNNKKIVYIPSGLAHGFYVKSKEDALMLYNTTEVYYKEYDSGIHYSSFGIEWNFDKQPILSEKDENLVKGEFFNSPF